MSKQVPDQEFPDDEELSQTEKAEDHKLSKAEILEKLTNSEAKVTEHWERIVRMQADYDNALRRAERDVTNASKFALEKFVGELLPIVDSLELCVNNVPAELPQAGMAVIDGVNLTLKMFYSALEKFGIKQVNPVNESFNPELEQAISAVYDPKIAPGKVISVLQKGYTLNNRLIRPALVVVSKAEQ